MIESLRRALFALPVLLVACSTPPEPAPKPVAPAAPVAAPIAAPVAAPVAAAADTAGMRPGLGLMPDYEAGTTGVRVASVREGSAADKAGIAEGDILIALHGIAIEDAQSYSDALDAQTIGATIPVKVRRGEQVLELQVVVGARRR